jgi:ribonuclease R
LSDRTNDGREGAWPTSDQIRKALADSARGPLKPKDLARELRIPKHRYRDFRKLLASLERDGDIYRVRGNRYAVPDKINLIVGVLQMTRAGDAFLRPDQKGEREVFVPSSNLESAMDGDRVTARIEGFPRGKAPVARVVKVLERAHATVVGTLHVNRNFGFVTPLDSRMSRDILIPAGASGDAREGDVVVVRITQFGDRRQNAVGEVEKVLGPMEDPGVDVLAILHGHGLPAEFPAEVNQAAQDASALVHEPGEREDLRDLHVFTIDPADARDHDDALSVTELGEGLWEVGIHIADVSHFVQEGSPLDLEAYHRGTSVYLVDQVVPMLPHLLSSDLCSLVAGQDRFALSLLVTLDLDGRVRSHRFVRSWIRCAEGLDYEQVAKILEGDPGPDPKTNEALIHLDRLARILRQRRRERGSLDFDLPEARVILDDEGVPIDILRRVQLDSHRLIEDFMILANEVVAREAQAQGLPVPYRVHEPPSGEKSEELRSFLGTVGYALPKGRIGPKALQKLLEKASGRPESALVSTVLLRSMSRARYDPENLGHFGLASRAYAHFTSPIRRYPDLALHRAVGRTLIDGKPPPERWKGERLDEMSRQASDRERLAQRAERDSVDLKKVEFMQRHLGDEFEGTIAGVTSFGFFVLLDRYFVEGLVHVSSLDDDYYAFDQDSLTLTGRRSGRRFRIGDHVRVQVARASKEERRIDFQLISTSGGGSR